MVQSQKSSNVYTYNVSSCVCMYKMSALPQSLRSAVQQSPRTQQVVGDVMLAPVLPRVFAQLLHPELWVQSHSRPPGMGLCPLQEVSPSMLLDGAGGRPSTYVVGVLGTVQLDFVGPVVHGCPPALYELQVL
eukprot:CAMPEP_0117668764 /NCGR_PEP_ID=MMETSP0804-20121206/11740_1 /TAXON_ID=1074897 /ORGANISM="Tetraselmis astigmatica, Strain CCMP880" /LENGTH=131 /DNA_ID=CAMNT_0005476711 /DNA_START=28 /DNA_END=423 /DNA_ORIENTATION=+